MWKKSTPKLKTEHFILREGGASADTAPVGVSVFKEAQIRMPTYQSSVFGQAHIAMVILVKRLTFGPCWWLLGDTPIAMVMASRRTLTLPWWWWQEPGIPTNEMMDRCHARGIQGKCDKAHLLSHLLLNKFTVIFFWIVIWNPGAPSSRHANTSPVFNGNV